MAYKKYDFPFSTYIYPSTKQEDQLIPSQTDTFYSASSFVAEVPDYLRNVYRDTIISDNRKPRLRPILLSVRQASSWQLENSVVWVEEPDARAAGIPETSNKQ